MSAIPASSLVNINPGVLAAGGTALELVGLCLSKSTRVPIGTVPSFPTAGAVGAYFGLASGEYAEAQIYFQGYTNRTAVPAALLFAQYNAAAVAAYVRGASLAAVTLPQLQAITGTLSVVMDGYTYSTASVNLSAASSFSAAAATLQTELNASEPSVATVTASVGASFTATASGANLTVTAVTGYISPGDKITGTGVPANTTILSQTSGTAGAAGVYVTSATTTATAAAITSVSNVLNVTAVASGTVQIGQAVTGGTLTASQIASLGTGTGGVGTYVLSGAQQSQTSTTVTCSGPVITVVFDSVSNAFTITSGSTGTVSTVAFPTGTAAAPLALTQATGATLSQGAAAASPAAFMTGITNLTQNWATFFTAFDPDNGSGNTVKKAFAAWNTTQNDRWTYVAADTDITPTLSTNASTSLGQYLLVNEVSGTIAVYEPTNLHLAAFVSGMIASINFNQPQGRITLAYKGQAGLTPSVTNGTVAANLLANGYNFYGEYSTAAQNFNYFQPGSISGPFKWADAYVDEIWLDNALQLAGMVGLGVVNSVPYNTAGVAIITAFCTDPITQAVTFGMIQEGVTLSAAQVEETTIQAGLDISSILQTRGWYLQVLLPAPSVRGTRGSFIINLWYTDGGSVQMLNINSTDVQ